MSAGGAAATGAVLGAGAQIYGGIQARKAAKKQQRAFDEQARLEQEAAEFAALQKGREFDSLLGTQKARISASGIVREGTSLLILEETLRDKEETINNILKTGAARARAYRNQAANARDAGRAAMTSSIIGAFGSGASAFGKSRAAKSTLKTNQSNFSY